MTILHVQCLVKIGADETLLEAVVGVCHVTHNGWDSQVCGRYSFHESVTTDVVYVRGGSLWCCPFVFGVNFNLYVTTENSAV